MQKSYVKTCERDHTVLPPAMAAPILTHSDSDVSDIESNGKPAILHDEIKATWKGRLWDTFDLPPQERKLMIKVDALLITFASVSSNRGEARSSLTMTAGILHQVSLCPNV